MSCENYQDAMMAYLDGVLPSEEAGRLVSHCESCAECRAELAAYSLLIDDLEAVGQVVLPGLPDLDLAGPVMAAAARQKAEANAGGQGSDVEKLMAYLEGDLDEVSQARFERRLAESPVLRQEAEALSSLSTELEALGDSLFAELPAVDLVDSVLRAAGISEPAPSVTPFRTRPKPQIAKAAPRPHWSAKGLAIAAAVILVAALGLMTQPWFLQSADQDGPLAKSAPGQSQNETAPLPGPEKHPGETGIIRPASLPRPPKSVEEPKPARPRSDENTATDGETSNQELTLDMVLAARRKALMDGAERLSLMGQWASLTPEEAQALISQSGLSKEALIGATQFLSPEEAAAILKAAVSENPEDPYLRYALAKNYAGDNTNPGDTQAQLAAWSNLDPENSVPLYMEARTYLAQSDPASAISTLNTASTYVSGSAYGLESAQYQQEALIASGMNPDVARFLVANTAGSTQYSDMTELAQDLVRYGQYYESVGDYETAKQVYNAVRQMGSQLVEGASLSTEQLTGLETQIIALDAFEQLYSILQDPANQIVLEAAYNAVRDSLALLGDLFSGLDTLWTGADTNTANSASNEVMQNGDLNLLSLFGF